jgi:DNA-binding response OmpR family regulator
MSHKRLIMILNRNKKNLELMEKFILPEGYQVQGLENLNKLKEAVKSDQKADLVLIDLTGFDKSIWGICENLREKQIPFLVISPLKHRELHKESMKHGAQDFLVKPLVVKEILALIKEFIETED